jgi:hypothetical protein
MSESWHHWARAGKLLTGTVGRGRVLSVAKGTEWERGGNGRAGAGGRGDTHTVTKTIETCYQHTVARRWTAALALSLFLHLPHLLLPHGHLLPAAGPRLCGQRQERRRKKP